MSKRLLSLSAAVLLFCGDALAHEMQHGFIFSDDGRFAEHLVADGHHSHQVAMVGTLEIPDPEARARYVALRRASIASGRTWFILLGQKVDLPRVRAGQVIAGPIVENAVGDWNPRQIVVPEARFTIRRVLTNVVNPFFVSP